MTTPKVSLTNISDMSRLGLGVLQDFTKLKIDSQSKNIAAWTPVVAEIFDGFVRFDDKAVSTLIAEVMARHSSSAQFVRYLPAVYPLATELLSREIAPEIRQNLREYFMRVGYAKGIIERS